MEGIPPELNHKLRTVLLKCDQFQSDSDLKALFVDRSISPWCDRLPQMTGSTDSRVSAVISYLFKYRSNTRENALVLFVRVLSQHIDPGDERHQQLAYLANDLEEAITNKEHNRANRSQQSSIYIERPEIEDKCEQKISRIGGMLRIKAPRHMGKTDLKNKILHRAHQNDCKTIDLNLEMIPGKYFNDLDMFLRCFCRDASKMLNDPMFYFPKRLEDYWDSTFSSKYECRDYFQERLLPQISSSALILSLDNIDILYRNSDLADEFFGLLRAWSEETKRPGIWSKLRLVLAYSRRIIIANEHQSPFNVGTEIELPEFTVDQVLKLANIHNLSDWDNSHVLHLMKMVGGHPYLVANAIDYIANNEQINLDAFLNTAPTNDGIYKVHLEQYLYDLSRGTSSLKMTMKKIVKSSEAVYIEDSEAHILESMGLVTRQGNEVKPRCQLYRSYFQNYL